MFVWVTPVCVRVCVWNNKVIIFLMIDLNLLAKLVTFIIPCINALLVIIPTLLYKMVSK